MVALRLSSILLVLALAAMAAGVAGISCTSGTTPVCDDAGSCLIYSPQSASTGDSGTSDDAPPE
jgi:hypothetical protein